MKKQKEGRWRFTEDVDRKEDSKFSEKPLEEDVSDVMKHNLGVMAQYLMIFIIVFSIGYLYINFDDFRNYQSPCGFCIEEFDFSCYVSGNPVVVRDGQMYIEKTLDNTGRVLEKVELQQWDNVPIPNGTIIAEKTNKE